MKLSMLYEDKKKRAKHGTEQGDIRDPRAKGGEDADTEGRVAKTVKRGPAKGASIGVYRGPFE